MIRPSGHAVHYDLQTFRVSDAMLMVELERRHAPCQMHCIFCPRTLKRAPRDLPPPDATTQARILQRFRQAVLSNPTPDVYLQSDDILRYPGLFDLLDFLHREGKRIHIASPGLALADRAFAERLVPYDLRVDLTVHARDADTFEAMTGHPGARDRIWTAIGHLRDLGIEYALAMVVTTANVHDAGATLRALADIGDTDLVRLLLFYPDIDGAPSSYFDQMPSFEAVNAQLDTLAGTEGLHRIDIANLPPCQLDLEAVRGLTIKLSPDFNTHRDSALEGCAACPAASWCPRVHPSYRGRHPLEEPDLDHVRAVLDALG